MRNHRITASVLVACLAFATASYSQGLQPGAGSAAVETSQRQELGAQVVAKWSNHIQEVYKTSPDDWASQMSPLFANAPLDTLQRAANATNFDTMNNILMGTAPAATATTDGGQLAQLLGDAANDLVFVPISPCRIFDTRLAGGAIAANSSRSFDVTAVADYAFQGGDASNCNGTGAAGSFAAALINFTVVTPAAGGYITAFPFGGAQPLASTLNYAAGDIRGNLSIVRLDQGASANELTVYSLSQTHLVGDIAGYFITPQATPLQCQDTADTVTAVAAGATANSVAPACPAGYTQTATNCESSTWQMPFVYFSGGTCSAQNNSSSAATLRSSRTCCRVPGR